MALVGPDGIHPISTQAGKEVDGISPFLVSVVFSRETGLGVIKMKQPGAATAFLLSPMEARLLGADLMVKSEAAICNAVAMRLLTEPSMGNMPIEQAVQAMDILGGATREAHNLAELEHQKNKREKEEARGKADEQ